MKQGPAETWESTHLKKSLNDLLVDPIAILPLGGHLKSECWVCYKISTDSSVVVNMVIIKKCQQALDLNV